MAHTLLNDADFMRQIEHCSLPSNLFTHQAHLRFAWLHLRSSGLHRAIPLVNAQLLAYVNSLGANHKYNQTLTTAAVLAVHHFMKKSQTDRFDSFIQQFPQLSHSLRELMNRHYSVDIWESPLAKNSYLASDRLPFES